MSEIESFPTTLPAFAERFPDEEACLLYLLQARWPNGFICPRCDQPGWRLRNRAVFECSRGHQVSLTAGTVFHGTRRPLRLWFFAMFLMTSQKTGLSATSLKRLLGLRSYQTAWHWLHKLRAAMVTPGRSRLVGQVEEDECFMPGKSSGQGAGCGLAKVIGAVEVRAGKIVGRVRLALLSDQSKGPLIAFTEANVEPGTLLKTDGKQAYLAMEKRGYRVEQHVRDPLALPGIHRIFGLMQRWATGTHHGAITPKHYNAYLNEYAFRFNRRRSSSPGRVFARLLENAVVTPALPWRGLVLRPNRLGRPERTG